MILPSKSSQRRMGLTISASSVPFSRSRTIETAIWLIVVCIRSAPIRPGTMKIAETRSGLYQARTRTSSRRLLPPQHRAVGGARRICSARCAARGGGRVHGGGRHLRIGGVDDHLHLGVAPRQLGARSRAG